MDGFIIIGPIYAINYKEVYELFKKGVLKCGVYEVGWELGYTRVWKDWLTTLTPNRPENKKLVLTQKYDPDKYPVYDNYTAIESKSKDVPIDYQGLIGVPVSFCKYIDYLPYEIVDKTAKLQLGGKNVFERLIIRRKQL